jgi:hypothetical protein
MTTTQKVPECKECGSRKLDAKGECQDCGYENVGHGEAKAATAHKDWYALEEKVDADAKAAPHAHAPPPEAPKHKDWYSLDGQDPNQVKGPKARPPEEAVVVGNTVKLLVGVVAVALIAAMGVIVYKMTQPVDTSFHKKK